MTDVIVRICGCAALVLVLLPSCGAAPMTAGSTVRSQQQQLPSGTVLRIGFDRWISALAYSPDGSMIATASEASIVKVWDSKTGLELRSYKGHKDAVLAVCFSPDGKVLASASADKTVRLWQVSTGKDIGVLSGHEEAVLAVAFSPNGKHIASGGRDDTVRLWDTATLTERLEIKEHQSWVTCLAFSLDSTVLISGSMDNTVLFWDVESGRKVRAIPACQGHEHSNWITTLSFSPDGKTLAFGSDHHPVMLVSVTDEWEPLSLAGHKEGVCSASYSPDGQLVVAVTTDRIAVVWEVVSGRELLRIPNRQSGYGGTTRFSPLGTLLATVESDHTISVMNLGDVMGGFGGGNNDIDISKIWESLGAEDPRVSWSALAHFTKARANVKPLQDNLLPNQETVSGEFARLVLALGADEIEKREQAKASLRAMGFMVEPALRSIIRGEPPNGLRISDVSSEMKTLCQSLVLELERPVLKSIEARRQIRAIWALEHHHTPSAAEVLRRLATGNSSRLSSEASKALRRLEIKKP